VKQVTLLIDGDILVWRAAAAAQRDVDWGHNVYTSSADVHEAIGRLDSDIASLRSKLKATDLLIALSDPERENNWRRTVLPSYKSNRSTRKPLVFFQCREHLEHAYRCATFPRLEGDDVVALYATGVTIPGRRIVVSIDKDFLTVPCNLYNPGHPERGVVAISVLEADRAHAVQTLTGDPVDGYAGCPGVGKIKAERAIASVLVRADGAASGGARESWCRWGWWQEIVRLYQKAGLTEADALVQARVARILRAGEYNRKTGAVKLWEPPA
jgi:DNA polymerase-1